VSQNLINTINKSESCWRKLESSHQSKIFGNQYNIQVTRALTNTANPNVRNQDESLAQQITTHFLTGAAFPENDAHISRSGFVSRPPTPYQQPWSLEDGEVWLAHGLGTYFFQLQARGDFKQAGAAAILITDRAVRLLLGVSSVEKPTAISPKSRGEKHIPNSHFEARTWRFLELSEIGAGDLLLLKHWKLEPVILRVPWARSLAAMISGLRLIAKQPLALEDGVIDSRKPGFNQAFELPKTLILEAKTTPK
jgi:hypothetical protein